MDKISSNPLGEVACCKQVIRELNDPEAAFWCDLRTLLFTGLFSVFAYRTGDYRCAIDNGLSVCLWCGELFPDDLREIWRELAEEKFGEINLYDEKEFKRKISREFLTEEWWKNLNIKLTYTTPDEKKGDKLCCDLLNFEVYQENCPKHKYKRCSTFPLMYEPEKRRFFFSSVPCAFLLHKVHENNNAKYRIVYSQIFFCPWCGAKLPTSLGKEWFEIVSQKFGVTNLSDSKQLAKVPKKYMSEEWWREEKL